MAVTTEPPWLNKSGGVAARNGTSTHAINFTTDGDAPFTPTSGSLLVFIIYGAVTHTVSAGGWNERLSPVSNGELSVFTVDTTSHTGISVTHNASNYPSNWEVFEFPAGSTYTGGTSNNAANSNNQTWPALGSLPGTEQVIIAARGQAQASSGGSTITAGWSSPWVEDYDQAAAYATTDGCWLNVAHKINETGTSVTPTSTYASSNVTNNIQQIVIALDVAAIGGGSEDIAGALTAPAATMSGTLTSQVAITSAMTGPAATMSGSGTSAVAVAGSLAGPAATMSGSATSRTAITGALVAPAGDLSGVLDMDLPETSSPTPPIVTMTRGQSIVTMSREQTMITGQG